MSDIDEYESLLRRQLANLHEEFHMRSKHIVDELVKIQSLRTPPPIFINADELPPELIERLKKATP